MDGSFRGRRSSPAKGFGLPPTPDLIRGRKPRGWGGAPAGFARGVGPRRATRRFVRLCLRIGGGSPWPSPSKRQCLPPVNRNHSRSHPHFNHGIWEQEWISTVVLAGPRGFGPAPGRHPHTARRDSRRAVAIGLIAHPKGLPRGLGLALRSSSGRVPRAGACRTRSCGARGKARRGAAHAAPFAAGRGPRTGRPVPIAP